MRPVVRQILLGGGGRQSPFAKNGATYPFYAFPTFPHASYNASLNKTAMVWEAWDGTSRRAAICLYDHAAKSFSPIYLTGTMTITDDSHGNPSVMWDASNFLHIFYDRHNSGSISHISSYAAGDISKWRQQPGLGAISTYSAPLMVGSVAYLFLREYIGSSEMDMSFNKSAAITNGIVTWSLSTVSALIAFGASTRVYFSGTQLRNGTDVHFIGSWSDLSGTAHRNVYYFILDTTDGSLKNFDKSFSTASGSLPLSLATCDSHYKIVSQPTAGGTGYVLSLGFDSSGVAHVLFSDTTGTLGTSLPQTLYHTGLYSGAWTTAVQIGTTADGNSDACVVSSAGGGMDAYWTSPAGLAAGGGGSISTARRTSGFGGSWGGATTVQVPFTFGLNEPCPVFNGQPELSVIWSEVLPSDLNSAAGIGTLKMWGYGNNGYVGRKSSFVPVEVTFSDKTFNPLDCSTTVTLSNDYKTAVSTAASSPEPQVRSIASRSSGKVHVEFTITNHISAATQDMGFGLASASQALHAIGFSWTGSDTKSVGLWPASAKATQIFFNGVSTDLGSGMRADTGDVFAMEVDLDGLKIWFKNITKATGWNNDILTNQNPATGTGGFSLASLVGAPYCYSVDFQASGNSITVNVGETAFATTPSAGFGAWA